MYGYSPPPQGKWWIDDTEFLTEDFRTVEKYREYKDCGFNILFMQGTASFDGKDWANSDTKRCMQYAVEAGLDKVILVGETLVTAVKCGYVAAGGDLSKLTFAKTLDGAKPILQEFLGAGDAVLFLNDLPDVF